MFQAFPGKCTGRTLFTLSFLTLPFLFTVLGCGGDGEETAGEAAAQPNPEAPGRGAGPAGGSAQEAPVTLELEARYPEGFSFLNSIREMPDGTVLAADPLAEVFLRIGPDLGSSDTIGRAGPGPQEYEQPDGVFSLPGESSLLVDLGKMQLTEVLPDGTFGDGISMAIPAGEGFPTVLHPRFADDRGGLYDQAGRSRDQGPPDSAAVIRLDRETGAVDTAGIVWLPEYAPRRTRNRGYLPTLLQPADDWAVAPDGSLAVVRAAGFSIDWHFADGTSVAGDPHDFQTFPVRQADKEAVLTEMQSSGISMTAATSRDGSVSRMTMSRGVPGGGDGPGVDEFEWAETLPLFRAGRSRISPAGELWVERHMPAGSETRWELFDRTGAWLGSVVLPPRYQLIGFGRAEGDRDVVYLTRTDEFELKWLERFRVVR